MRQRAQGALVLVGRCYDRTETPPYGPWLELFAHYPADATLPSLPAVFAERGMIAQVESQAALFQQVREFLDGVTTSRPLVLLFDDLHWADPASLDLLRSVARMATRLPLLLLVTYRANELTRQHPLSHLLPLMERESLTTRLNPQPLDADAVRALIETRYSLTEPDAARLTSYLQQRAEGNAFFITELLRALEEGGLLHHAEQGWTLGDLVQMHVPVPLRQVIDGRLARLGEEAQPLLAVAAVIGQEIPLDVWAAVTGADEETLSAILEQAIPAHLMDETPDGMHARFVHALIRETLYEGILPSRRRRMHRQIGEALADQVNADPDMVAYHFRQAGDPRAIEWLVRAGERAERAYALPTATDRFAAAQELLKGREQDAAQRGWLLLRIGLLRRLFFIPQVSRLAPLEEAVALALAAHDDALAASAIYAHGFVLCMGQQFREGLAELDRGMAMAAGLSVADRARLRTVPVAADHLDERSGLAAPAEWRAFVGRFAETRAIAEQIIEGGPNGAAHAWQGRICGHYAYRTLSMSYAAMGDPERARAAFARARAIARDMGDPLLEVQAAADELERLVLAYSADCPDERQLLVEEMRETWIRCKDILRVEYSEDFYLVPLFVISGHWEAVRVVGLVEQTWRTWRSFFFTRRALAEVARYQGNGALVRALVADLLPQGAASEPGETRFLDATAMQRVAAGCALDQGDLETARQWLASHDHWLDWSDAVRWRSEGHTLWGQYYRASGDPSAARRHACVALETASDPRQPLALLAAHRLLGQLDNDAGQYRDAAAHLDAALVLAEACDAPYERALILLSQAELHAASGNRVDAMPLLDAARAICTPLGAQPALARADALAASVSATAPPPPMYPDGMTEREVEVLRTIAAGMSNREIAERLSVSIRTVERHIENLYRKIDARSKAEATSYAFRHDLT